MTCSTCGFANPDGMRFCGQCGGPMRTQPVCAACGVESPVGFRFCGHCGGPLGERVVEPVPRPSAPHHLAEKIRQSKAALEGERKQVTVLFADVKGSMDLAEQLDPEEWSRIMQRFFTLLAEGVARFEGFVDKFTGDGIMALFGAPIAHEDHAQRACFAALALRDALRDFARAVKRQHGLDFATRIGLNSGQVVVGTIGQYGDDLRVDYTAQGHTVGLAQRMEALASAGSIYLSEHTRKLALGYFELEDLGAFDLKGVAEPMHVYELVGVGAARTRFDVSRTRGLVRFVGREAETRALDAALAAARAGQGAVAAVVAQAGTGKSRLCFEFLEACRRAGLTVHEGRAVAHGTSIPLIPILEIFRSYYGIDERDDPRMAREKIAGRLLLLDGSFRDVLPVLFDFLGVADPAEPTPPMEAEARQRQLLGVARRLFQRASSERPAVLLIEDLHWLDAASEVWLRDWADAVAGTRTLLLVNFRPEYRAEWMQRSHVQQLALAPLGPEAIRELLEDLLGTDPSTAGLAGVIHERTGGNPFFAEEVVRSLIESGHLAGQRGRYRLVTAVEKLPVPDTVQALLAARIDRLPERERRVLQTAAVIGKDVRGPILERVVDVTATELSESLANLRNAEFVYETALYPVAEYSFKHPLTREVALGSQLGERRRNVHAAVARAIETLDADRLNEEAAVLAHHWEEAGEMLAAARWHGRAAGWAMRSDTAAAHRHWLRAKDLAAVVSTHEAGVLEGEALGELVNLGWRLGLPLDEIRDYFETARRRFEASGDRRSLCLLYSNYALMGAGAGLHSSVSHECYLQANRLARELADPSLQIAVGVTIGSVINAGLLRESLGWTNACIELIETRGWTGSALMHFDEHAWAYGARAWARMYLGDVAEAVADSDRAFELARRGSDFDRYLVHSIRNVIESLRGDVNRALEHARWCVELSDKVGGRSYRSAACSALGHALSLVGRWQEALPWLEEAHALRLWAGTPSGGLALVLYRCGEPERALAAAREDAATAARQGYALAEVALQIELAEVAARCGHEAEARGALARAGDVAARIECRILVPKIHETAAMLAAALGDAERQQAELREAHRLYQGMRATGHAERLGQELAS